MNNERLRVLFCDHLSLARGKYLSVNKMNDTTTRLCQGVYALTYSKNLVPAPGGSLLQGLHDMVLSYSASDIRDCWQADTKVVIADQLDSAGIALPMCGRSLLKRTVAQWVDKGLMPKVGVELEAFAFVRDEQNGLQPYHTPGAFVYGTGPMLDPNGFSDAIWSKASELGFALESMSSEFDAPQFEFTLKYNDAVKAVDDTFLFRQMAREVAYERGIVLTFMPKPIDTLGGSGVHINISFNDDAGENIILDDKGVHGLSDIAQGSIAGLLHHHTALAGLIAPTVNSYQRLRPASLAGYWKNWGIDHRGVTVRIANDTPQSARIEHRMGDAGANPYTQVAAILQAALLGVEHHYVLPPPESQDCLELQDATCGVGESLSGALDALENDSVFSTAIGEMLIGNHIGIKRAEIDEVSKGCDSNVRDYYIYYI